GLNPAGRDELLEKIKEFHDKRKMTIVFVSHDMDAIARYADRVIVLSGGNLVLDAAPTEVFANKETIEEAGLLLPRLTTLLRTLEANGLKLDMKPKDMLTVEGAVRGIMAAKKAAPKTRDSKTGGKG
ncbi:MAG: energy-coupling factor ABC transporter ATP-binding protein, partial [Schwartzia sp.]|nr:energy-coupling factor ABC transporter ATP-binding protein [Schwartzia sp. (in: firmicutes)]